MTLLLLSWCGVHRAHILSRYHVWHANTRYRLLTNDLMPLLVGLFSNYEGNIVKNNVKKGSLKTFATVLFCISMIDYVFSSQPVNMYTWTRCESYNMLQYWGINRSLWVMFWHFFNQTGTGCIGFSSSRYPSPRQDGFHSSAACLVGSSYLS